MTDTICSKSPSFVVTQLQPTAAAAGLALEHILTEAIGIAVAEAETPYL